MMHPPHSNFRDQRRIRIIEVAKSVFYESGYAAATMSQISERLGGSKATLYAYFKNKSELFAAIISEQCDSMLPLFKVHGGNERLADILNHIGRHIMVMVMSDRWVRTTQLVIEEAKSSPELASLMHETMQSQSKAQMIDLLKKSHEKGEVYIDDFDEASDVLAGLMMGKIYLERLLSVRPEPSMDDISRHVARAVTMFMTYYAPK